MKIGGFLKTSLIDYPGGMISAVIFTQGCNFRCPFCHNPELVIPEKFGPLIPEEEIFEFLKGRRGQLQGVVITGGEPTIHSGLKSFIERVKALGFAVKLDTNGSNPEVLEELLPLLDYISMDIKAPLEKYSHLAGVRVDILNVQRSIRLIRKSNIEYEFRTTFVKPLLDVGDFKGIGKLVAGAKRFALQKFVHSKHISDSPFESPSGVELEAAKKILSEFVENIIIRD